MPEMLCEGKEWQSYDDGFKPCLRNLIYERECGSYLLIFLEFELQKKGPSVVYISQIFQFRS